MARNSVDESFLEAEIADGSAERCRVREGSEIRTRGWYLDILMAALITRRAARGSRDKDDDAPDVENAALRAADNGTRSHSLVYVYIPGVTQDAASCIRAVRARDHSRSSTAIFTLSERERERSFLDLVLSKITTLLKKTREKRRRVKAKRGKQELNACRRSAL